jgi:predicted phage terminase large subunit-like protein
VTVAVPTLDRAAAQAELQKKLHQIRQLEQLEALAQGREQLLRFCELTMEEPTAPDDRTKTRFTRQRHHEEIAKALEAVERGDLRRLIITMPPRHGKSELASRRFPAWFVGRDPYRNVIFGTYNSDLALDFGRDVREIMISETYGDIFPGVRLRKGSKAADRMETTRGGKLFFAGAGEGLTGRGADLLLIDDPLKDRKEADSPTIRNDRWKWFAEVAMTRLSADGGLVVIIMTRWHDDDIIGRLTDPNNDMYNPELAKGWHILELPALAGDDDPIGREPGEALWPSKYSAEWLSGQRSLLGPRAFSALYQCSPTPDEGDFFKREWLHFYAPAETPKAMRIYAASDHAVKKDQDRDATCLLIAGVDEADDIWILEAWWRREKTDTVVDAMVDLMRRWQPITWWAEKGHISQSIGPFLEKRMREEKLYRTVIEEKTPTQDKQQRAQSIRGRMAMGKVHLPAHVPWRADAMGELLRFPSAAHDDFVDALAYIGLGLAEQRGPRRKKRQTEPTEPRTGSLAWMRMMENYRKAQKAAAAAGGF